MRKTVIMSPAFERFIRPARARPEFWRLLLGVIVMVAVYAAFIGAMFGLLAVTGSFGGALPDLGLVLTASTPGGLIVLLFTFIGMGIAPMVAARLLHGRGPGTLFGRGALVLRDFAIAAAVVASVLGVSLVIWSIFFDAVPGLPFERWILFLPAALVLLLIQTGAEELVFRGYLQQQLAARFASPFVWAALPAVLFGFAHFAPDEAGPNVWIGVAITALFGLLAADLTAKTGSHRRGLGPSLRQQLHGASDPGHRRDADGARALSHALRH